MATAGRVSGLVIHALKHLGKQHVNADVIGQLRRSVIAKDKKQLLRDARYAPAWIADHMALFERVVEHRRVFFRYSWVD
jgi:hypothetical protein